MEKKSWKYKVNILFNEKNETKKTKEPPIASNLLTHALDTAVCEKGKMKMLKQGEEERGRRKRFGLNEWDSYNKVR